MKILTASEPNILITEGAILPFSKQFANDTCGTHASLSQYARKNSINPRVPLRELTEDQKSILLNGTGNKQYEVEGAINRFGDVTHITGPFTGVIAELQRKYNESSSELCPERN